MLKRLKQFWNKSRQTDTSKQTDILKLAKSPPGIEHNKMITDFDNGDYAPPSQIQNNFTAVDKFKRRLPADLGHKLDINHKIVDENQPSVSYTQPSNYNNLLTTVIPHNSSQDIISTAARNVAHNSFGKRKIKDTTKENNALDLINQENKTEHGTLEDWAKSHLAKIIERHHHINGKANYINYMNPGETNTTMLQAINEHIQSLKGNPHTRRFVRQLLTRMHPNVLGLTKRLVYKSSTEK